MINIILFSPVIAPNIDMKSMEKGELYGLPRVDAKIQLWTDGSLRKGGQAGAGLYMSGGLVNQGFRLGEGVSIWQAELYAIYRGCLWILDNPREVEGEKVVFNVDSTSAIKALMKHSFNSNILGRTLEALKRAADICNKPHNGKIGEGLWVRWVKSHQDNNPLYVGNYNADALAVRAAESDWQIEPDAPKVARGTWKLDLRLRTDALW